jgi:HAMP domain-containing protein
MLGLLTLLTSAAGALGSYFLAQRLSQPLRVLKGALTELAKGNYAYRIGETRRDELGELYSAFDAAADALEKRYDTLAPPTLLASLPGEALASATTSGPGPAEAEHRPGPPRSAEAVAGSTSA